MSEDNDTLIHHQIEFHQDILKSAQAKFAKELVSAGGDESIADFSANFESMSEELLNSKASSSADHRFPMNASKKPRKKTKMKTHAGGGMSGISMMNNSLHNANHNNNGMPDANEFDDFWKAGFMDNYGDQPMYFNQASLGNVDSQNESVNSSRSSTPKSQSSNNLNIKDLPATRIRRQYTCTDCGFRTVNPREFLYHRRDGHGHKIKIVECPYCVYACQYVQKLQRHLLLVHKLQTLMTPSGEPITNGDGENVVIKRKYKKLKHDFDGSSILDNDISNSNFEPGLFYYYYYYYVCMFLYWLTTCPLVGEMDMEDNQSLNDEDFEHMNIMNNFEMNFNEYDVNADSKEGSTADSEKDGQCAQPVFCFVLFHVLAIQYNAH